VTSRKPFVALICACSALAACGGGDGDDGPGSDDRTLQEEADASKAIAQAGALELSDFPSGWQEDDEPTRHAPSHCDAIRRVRADATAREESPRYEQGDAGIAENLVAVYADEATAETVFDAVASRETRTCLGDELVARIEDQIDEVEVGEAKTDRLAVDPIGTQTDAGRLTLTLTADGSDLDLIIDFTFVRVDRGLMILTTGSPITGPDQELRGRLAAASVERLTAAFDGQR
jgi:hypothetical protein